MSLSDDQCFNDQYGNKWRVTRLIELSKNFKIEKIKLKYININSIIPKKFLGALDYIEHIKQVNAADLNCPIILSESGNIMDGRHRICKALLKNKSIIKAVIFKSNPEPDWHNK